MPYKKYSIADDAYGRLGSSVSTTLSTIPLSSSQNLTAGNWIGTLVQYGLDGYPTKKEKVYVTTNNSGILSVTRGYDGSPAQAFNEGDYIFMNVVVEVFRDMQEEISRLNTAKPDASNVYTKTEVDGKFSSLLNGAGPALDTLKEIQDALGNDANFASTITNALAGKVSKTGNVAETITGVKTLTSTPIFSAGSAIPMTGGNFLFDVNGGTQARIYGNGTTPSLWLGFSGGITLNNDTNIVGGLAMSAFSSLSSTINTRLTATYANASGFVSEANYTELTQANAVGQAYFGRHRGTNGQIFYADATNSSFTGNFFYAAGNIDGSVNFNYMLLANRFKVRGDGQVSFCEQSTIPFYGPQSTLGSNSFSFKFKDASNNMLLEIHPSDLYWKGQNLTGSWTSWSAPPTWSGGSTNPSIIDNQASYKVIGKTLYFKIWIYTSGGDRTGCTIPLPATVSSYGRTIFSSWSTRDSKPFFPFAFNSQNYINCGGFTQGGTSELYISGTCEIA